ncbi:ABC transporter permease subunit [bacterium]|nr:ABC transporter permease subunit [bacterium]
MPVSFDTHGGPVRTRKERSFSGVVVGAGRLIWPVFLVSIRRLVHSKFFYAALFLAALPVCLAVIILPSQMGASIGRLHLVLESFLRTVFLAFVVFFAGNILGFAVMRQEIDDQTLHFPLLQPTPRWALVVGKFAAALLLASLLCVLSLWLTYLVLVIPTQGVFALVKDLTQGGRFFILLKESTALVLGLLAYTTIAMFMGSFLKSIAYALILLAWDTGVPYLPSTAKMWTVMHYLQSLLPERLSQQRRLFELLGEPAPVWLCLVVLVGLSLVFLAGCLFIFHRRECLYGET